MNVPYAEVIGDPVAHSKSPLIHKFWLQKLGIAADYRATRVAPRELAAFLKQRRADLYWRGCNVTAPHKREAARLVGDPIGACAWLGAVNTIVRTPLGCEIGSNTDVQGIADAVGGLNLEGGRACLIGAGGAARAALCFLQSRSAHVAIVARDRRKGDALADKFAGDTEVHDFDNAAAAMRDASLIVNATPLGMTGQVSMSPNVLEGLAAARPGAAVLDMVYAPVETALLRAARERGLVAIDGLAMLIGQAAPAFEIFFGRPAPREYDSELRELLAS